ncbi:MAG: hypothetical protein D6712_07655, partial [Chloroflexi bacterium]
MSQRQIFVLFFTIVIFYFSAVAQIDHPLVISAENITSLRSVLRIDFAEYGDFESGWFALSEDG